MLRKAIVYDQLLFIESPVQIAIVLVIALIVFGPNRLPEVGRQIGQALRDLRKATGEVARSFNGEYEPESEPYSGYNSGSSTSEVEPYSSSSYGASNYTSAPDLTDYTIAGVPTKDAYAYGYTPEAVDDAYSIAGTAVAEKPAAEASASFAGVAPHTSETVETASEPSPSSVAAGASTQGEQHV